MGNAEAEADLGSVFGVIRTEALSHTEKREGAAEGENKQKQT